MKTTFCIRRGLAFGVLLAFGTLALAQTPPAGPLRIIVPSTPGTTPDILARIVSGKLGERLGRAVVVENKVGASGWIGAEFVAHGAPDGATLLLAASTVATGASLQPLSFSPVNDLTPVVLMDWSRVVLVAHPSTGFKTVQDLIAAARKSPGKLNYGSPGTGTPAHLTGELFKVKAGIDLTHIPYRGTAGQVNDVLAGQIEIAPITVSAALPHVRAGKLVALAVASDKRTALMPEVPSLAEAKVPGVNGDVWYGLFGPKGLPPAVIDRLNAELKEILRTEEKAMALQGIEIQTNTPEEFRQLMATDSRRWAELIKVQGIKAD